MYEFNSTIQKAVSMACSDIHITVGLPPMARVKGDLMPLSGEKLTPEDTLSVLAQIVTPEQLKFFEDNCELDASVTTPYGRFRLNAYRQKGAAAIALRLVNSRTPTFESLGLPPVIKELTAKTRGLILVTGPTGSGKSTTLAAMIDCINTERNAHILTLEEPIEYIHTHKMCMVNQREIGGDSASYAAALRAALREDPDVILIGEMRDPETISVALTAAETGHLVLSTLHTTGAAKTIDRIIDVFPPHQQSQARAQLSTSLQAVISQQLLPKADESGRVAALEIMIATPAIRNLIRENKVPQINNTISTSAKQGMKTMDASLLELVRARVITAQTAMQRCVDPEIMHNMLHGG